MPKWNVHFNMRVNTTAPEIVNHIANIYAISRTIRGIPLPPGIQQRLDALNIMRAVRGTTGIEGTELTEDEVLQIMQAPKRKRVLPVNRKRAEQEGRNADILMRYISKTLVHEPNLSLTEKLICRIHEILTRNIDYTDNIPGVYRTHAVSAGTYVPPTTEEEVRKLMTEFVNWFNNGVPKEWDLVIRAIVAHFYVVSIHPFGDGNGRVSRGMESFFLYKGGINARCFYSLANYYYRHRDKYVQMLDFVRFKSNGDLTPFLLFALQGLTEELEAVYSEVLSQVLLISYRDYVRETLERHNKLGTRSGERMFHFLLELTEPVSIRELRNGRHKLSRYYAGLSNKTLSRDLNFFVGNRLIVVEDGHLQPNVKAMGQFIPILP